MCDEIYDNLPKWRRVIRDLAREAGIPGFTNPSDEEGKEPASDSSSPKRKPTKTER